MRLRLLPLELGGGAFVAERFLLFPLALLALALSQLPLSVSTPVSRRAFSIARLTPYALALGGLAALATVQLTVPHWRSEQTLWEWGLRRAPQSPTPYTNLALVAVNNRNPPAGLALAEAALARDPNEDTAHNHRGLALFHLGRYEEAEAAFRKAIDLAPDNALYRSNLAGALREQGRLQEAERVLLDEALPRDPSLRHKTRSPGCAWATSCWLTEKQRRPCSPWHRPRRWGRPQWMWRWGAAQR